MMVIAVLIGNGHARRRESRELDDRKIRKRPQITSFEFQVLYLFSSSIAIDESACDYPMRAFFVADLHGDTRRYEKLFRLTVAEQPEVVLIGGDLLSTGPAESGAEFFLEYMFPSLACLKKTMRSKYPSFCVLLGNDDPRCHEKLLIAAEEKGLCRYIHGAITTVHGIEIYGLSYIPPSPFRLKDWERYDVSRYTDPGCISPEEGVRTVPIEAHEIKWTTIQTEIAALVGDKPLGDAVFLFHVPPYKTELDRAALDGKRVDGVDVDSHIGSIAVRRFIEERQPRLTLHGHVHESARLTGAWKTCIGRTVCISAAHDGPELALVRFDPLDSENASRELL